MRLRSSSPCLRSAEALPGEPAQNVLMDFVLPVWLAVGYLCRCGLQRDHQWLQ
jgi:hypothetical protein